MDKIIKYFVFMLFISSTWATNYYVDKDADGNNNGTSWVNAFTTITAGINAAENGDIIYISGGVTSKTYQMQATIAAGKFGITITKGLSEGHNGTVIIDGQYTRSYGIYANANSLSIHDITVRKIRFINCKWAGIYFSGQSSGGIQNILIDSCEFVDNRRSGVFMEGSSSTISIMHKCGYKKKLF